MTDAPSRADIATRFQPGKSGNPSGRPAIIKDIQALARKHTAAAINALVAALDDPRQRVPAAVALLDRGYGKAPQSIDVNLHAAINRSTDADLLAIAIAGSAFGAEETGDPDELGSVVH